MNITALPYEILRRDDRRTALSLNAGLIDFTPYYVAVDQDDFVIFDADRHPKVKLCKVSQDVRDRLSQDGFILLFEFVNVGIVASYRLGLVEAPLAWG